MPGGRGEKVEEVKGGLFLVGSQSFLNCQLVQDGLTTTGIF